MSSKNYIRFLGTAGARFVVSKQLRSSGGTLLSLNGMTIILDPGPGALVRLARCRPPIDLRKVDAIILSHSHIDHSNDVNVIIDSMTFGGVEKRGTLFAPSECLDGENAVVLRYLRDFLEEIVVLCPEREYRLGSLTFSTSMRHDHGAETYGIIFNLDGRRISFLVDTKYFPGLLENYRDSELLVLNVVRYSSGEFCDNIKHLQFSDIKEILTAIRPRTSILTHFGGTMLRAKPSRLASNLTLETGLRVIAAHDGMIFEL